MPAKTKKTQQSWAPEEDEILISSSEQGKTVPDVALLLPWRTEASIAKHGYDLGVTFARRKTGSTGETEKAYYRAEGALKHRNGLDVHYY